jgi:hypothetical protein
MTNFFRTVHRSNFFRFATPALVALAIAVGAMPASSAEGVDASTPVQVALPSGFSSTTTSVEPGLSGKTKFVIINMLRVRNASRTVPLDVLYRRFSLVTDQGDRFDVSARTKSLPFSLSEGSLGPGQGEVGSLAFEVPAGVLRAALMFDAEQFGVSYPTLY